MSDEESENQDPPEGSLIIALILAWVFPGLGHFYFKKHLRGMFCTVGILVLFFLGLLLCDWGYATRSDFPFYLGGRYGSGFVLFGHWLLTVRREIDFQVSFHYYEIGILCISVAGLLNSVSVLNLIDVKAGRKMIFEVEEREDSEEELEENREEEETS